MLLINGRAMMGAESFWIKSRRLFMAKRLLEITKKEGVWCFCCESEKLFSVAQKNDQTPQN
jgi:hypothetical protein